MTAQEVSLDWRTETVALKSVPNALSTRDFASDHGSPDVRVCAELAVPGLNTTAPLYHQLQQYKQTSTNMAEKRRETCRDPQGIATEDPLPLSVSVSVCQLSSISTLPTTPSIESVDSKPVEVDSDINVIANHFLPVTVLFLEVTNIVLFFLLHSCKLGIISVEHWTNLPVFQFCVMWSTTCSVW